MFPESIKRLVLGRPEPVHWCRVVMDAETARLVNELEPARLRVLEVSGDKWTRFGFRSYESTQFPEFDICGSRLDRRFDLVIAEQVLEHVRWPLRAGRTLYSLLEPGGYCLITTPFLIRRHWGPEDCSRWTAEGLKYLLEECGFPSEHTVTGAWGNRACAVANFFSFMAYRPRVHSLKNEPDFPVSVWALARRPLAQDAAS